MPIYEKGYFTLNCAMRLILLSYVMRLCPHFSSLLACILRKCIFSQPAANPGGATRPPACFKSGNGDLLQPSGSLGVEKGLQHVMRCICYGVLPLLPKHSDTGYLTSRYIWSNSRYSIHLITHRSLTEFATHTTLLGRVIGYLVNVFTD